MTYTVKTKHERLSDTVDDPKVKAGRFRGGGVDNAYEGLFFFSIPSTTHRVRWIPVSRLDRIK